MLHVWHTALAPEQFPDRIRTRARSFGPDWRLHWKAVRGGYRLWLCPELPVFRVRGQLPLRLWVRPEGEGCRVTGAFVPPLWSLALDVLAPPALTYAASLRTGRMPPLVGPGGHDRLFAAGPPNVHRLGPGPAFAAVGRGGPAGRRSGERPCSPDL